MSEAVCKILIIEDEEGIQEYYETLVDAFFNKPIVVKGTSVEELKKHLNSDVFDLIILDCNLPDGNRYHEISQILEKNSLNSTVKFFISGIPYAEQTFKKVCGTHPTVYRGYFFCKPILHTYLLDILIKEFGNRDAKI